MRDFGVSADRIDDEVIIRGRKFLIDTQREDGSWAMTSRPTKPGEEYSVKGWAIIGAGSS
ncbi:MAG: hypothetical protein WEB58_14565 [Planctomycetaceae bacterium]